MQEIIRYFREHGPDGISIYQSKRNDIINFIRFARPWKKGYSDSTVCYYEKINGDMEYSIALKKKAGGRLAAISGGFSGL